MKTRAITGFFFVIVMLASVLTGRYVFDVFYFLLAGFCLWEFYGLLKDSAIKPNLPAALINGAFIYLIFALTAYYDDANKLMLLLPVTLSAVAIAELFRNNDAPFTNIAYTYFGLLFTIVPFTFFHALGYLDRVFNPHLPLAFLLMLWGNDTGAYLVGSKFGRTKLFERHSPKKTWEGFIGGMIITIGVAVILNNFYAEVALQHLIWMAVLISIFGTIGDLIESMLKRSLNVKDSGGILPGHGGLLDRFDGLFMAAPIVYAYLYFVTNA
ncbi:phosphatidate cytidylyltransferase [Mucilaginibacter calamicampi]|uniref:Phosphatidate cytidylyltransferase n=1 Tax=Mucilaginibacter calamicampi TaxID=1302352 RepID=A0ABW2Z0I4_9SPHI